MSKGKPPANPTGAYDDLESMLSGILEMLNWQQQLVLGAISEARRLAGRLAGEAGDEAARAPSRNGTSHDGRRGDGCGGKQ